MTLSPNAPADSARSRAALGRVASSSWKCMMGSFFPGSKGLPVTHIIGVNIPDESRGAGQKIIFGPRNIQRDHAGVKRFAVYEPGNGIIFGIVDHHLGLGFIGLMDLLLGPEQPYGLQQPKKLQGAAHIECFIIENRRWG